MSDKQKKILIGIGIVLVVIFVLELIMNHQSPREKVENYVVNLGFSLDDTGTLYYKQISDIDLDKYEIGILINALNQLRNKLNAEERETAPVDELLLDIQGYSLIG